jgi:hypothetical protein
MPYSGDNDADLPTYVQDLSSDDRSQWVAVFNSVYEDCVDGGGDADECESDAFEQANGVVLSRVYRQTGGWVYDPRLGGSGYRNTETGQIMSTEAARALMENMVTSSANVADGMAEMLTDQQVSPADFRRLLRQEIKDNYITQYLQGAGGRNTMTQEDWGSVGGMIADQYRYLEDWYDDLRLTPADELSVGQIANRARMYINSSREAYERARARRAPEFGYTDKTWVLGPAEHCEDCLALADQEAILLDEDFIAPSTGNIAIPGSGDTICLTSCACHLEYS